VPANASTVPDAAELLELLELLLEELLELLLEERLVELGLVESVACAAGFGELEPPHAARSKSPVENRTRTQARRGVSTARPYGAGKRRS
jgi:hypothetical protein